MRTIWIVPLILLMACTAHAGSSKMTTDFRKAAAADSMAVIILRENLRMATDFAHSRSDLFDPDKEHRHNLMSREEKLTIWGTWNLILDSMAGLDSIRRRHGGFSLMQDRDRRETSFAIANAAFLAEYRHALEFIAIADKNPALDTVLNEAVPEFGIPAGTFGRFKFRFLNVAIATEFAALQVIGKTHGEGSPQLRSGIERDSGLIWKMGAGKGHELTLKNALAVVRDAGSAAWFPVQKGVSEWMGDTKVARRHFHLISEKQVSEMGKRLEPGDVLFERHEWYLSNLGLPGFWTHVALYVGTAEERKQFFNDPEVREWVRAQGVADGNLETLLRRKYPSAYRSSIMSSVDKRPARILEAISEGVSFTSLEYTGASDSIGIIRPRLSKREKAIAIVRAFHFSGRPYDFNFDFQTDSALVCSELVFKAYAPGKEMKGMKFPLSEVLGRKVSTPNGMVRQFDEEAGTSSRQADFVLFLDGYEKEKRAVESTVQEFRTSWQRPNWHILVQEPPVEARAQ